MSKPSRRAARAADRSTGRPGGSFAGDASSPRAGRRQRSRTGYRRSAFNRYRNWIFGIGGIAAAAILFGFLFLGSTGKTYACSTIWNPNPTASPAAGATPQLGYLQPDMGQLHNATSSQRYTNCPPASGSHYNAAGKGPVQPRLYGPDDPAEPQGWIHNLEHGALVILYRCDGDACTDAGQAKLQDVFASIPNSPVCNLPPGNTYGPGPVIARFDEMAWPYAAIVWDRVLPLQTLDKDLILQFFRQWGDKTDPEKLGCPTPSGAPSAEPSAAPGESLTPSDSVAPGGASPEASASPS